MAQNQNNVVGLALRAVFVFRSWCLAISFVNMRKYANSSRMFAVESLQERYRRRD